MIYFVSFKICIKPIWEWGNAGGCREMDAVLELYTGSNFRNFCGTNEKNWQQRAHFSNMSIKGKTSPKVIENQLARQSRLSEGCSIHHEVKVISHSCQIRCWTRAILFVILIWDFYLMFRLIFYVIIFCWCYISHNSQCMNHSWLENLPNLPNLPHWNSIDDTYPM